MWLKLKIIALINDGYKKHQIEQYLQTKIETALYKKMRELTVKNLE